MIFKVENILVKEFNKEESLKRAISLETNRLKKSVGLDALEKELEKTGKVDERMKAVIAEKWNAIEDRMREIEVKKKAWVEQRERDFYENEFESVLKDSKRLNVIFVSDYRKSKVESILWRNGLRDYIIEECHGNWLERILKDSGKRKEDIVYFSNNQDDMERGVKWGIKVERLNLDEERVSDFMGKIGLKTKNNGE